MPRPLFPLVIILLAGCGDITSPRAFAPPGGGNRTTFSYASVSVGGVVNCALVNAGSAMCWGSGTLGDGRTTESDTPVRVSGAHVFSDLAVGGQYACGVSTNGVGFCWGSNARGSLGDGSQVFSSIPVQVAGDLRFRTIAAAGHTCAVTVDGEAYCWGNNRQGQLGIASSDTVRLVPARVAGGLAFRDIGVGFGNSCGLTPDGAAYCWGENWGPTPQPVPTSLRFASLSMGRSSICVLTAEGEAYCWGENRGQFGNGERDDPELEPDPYHHTPVRVETELRFASIATDSRHTCAITADGTSAYCWGRDDSGQIGDGSPPGSQQEEAEFKLFPTRVRLSRNLAEISVGLGTSCAVTTGGELYCWGFRTGSASRPMSDEPVLVGG